MGGQDAVVGFYDGGGDLRGRVDSETQLRFFAVVNGKALQEERTQPGTSASSDCVEDEEALKSRAVVCQLPDAIEA